MYKIALCGAHGTGKTTLVKILAPKLNLLLLDKTLRTTWEHFGVSDFEKMPSDVRTTFQNHLLIKQIEREDNEGGAGFITDRSVLDFLGYTILSSDMSGSEFKLFEQLVKERLKNYTHFVYLPVEFEAENEVLRANVETRQEFAQIVEEYLEKWFEPGQYLKATGSVEDRLKQIQNYINND